MASVDWLIYLLILFPLLAAVFDSLCRLLFLAAAHLPQQRPGPSARSEPGPGLLVLILAHDEERVIGQGLSHLMPQAREDGSTRIAVIADHCSDATASVAGSLGARVLVRDCGRPGKSQALSWLVAEHGSLLSESDLIAVLDADTLTPGGFCADLRQAFCPGIEAIQCFIHPLDADGFPLTTLVSFSETLSGMVDDAARARLGWSVPLRGTGMAFRTGTFLTACRDLGSQVDDIELSVRLAELGVRVHLLPSLVVDDPKPDRVLGLARQRGRWLKGQRQMWKTKARSIFKLLRAGLPNWSLIQALLLKPKTALVAIRVVLPGILWTWPFAPTLLHSLMLGAVLGGLLVDAVYYLSGLRFVRSPGRVLLSLLVSPLLAILWLVSWFYSLLPTQEWLRAQDG